MKRHYGSNKKVILTILDKNMMAAGGRNAGIALAKGDYILFLDSDNEVYPDTVKLLVKAFSDRPDVDYIGFTSINAQRDDTIWLLSADYNWYTSMMKNKGENIPADEKGLERFYDTYYVPNAFAVTRKAVEA